MGGAGVEMIAPASASAYYPLSSAQKRMYTMFQVDPASTVYNMPVVLLLKGRVDAAALEEAFHKLVRRHESFRTSFGLAEDGKLVQYIANDVDFRLGYTDAGDMQAGSEAAQHLVRGLVQPFDFSVAPIFRAHLVKLQHGEETVHLLFQDKHHIISDGISEEIINKDIVALYAGETLPPLALQYKDFAVWEQAQIATESFQQKRKYWLEKFSGELPVLNLPSDFSRPKFKSLKGDYLSFRLDKELTAALNQLAAAQSTTLYILLFTIFKTLLYRYSHEKDLVIASDTANRTRPELQDIVGMFINKLVIRTQPSEEITFAGYLKQVNTYFMEALENQEYQFDMLVQDLNVTRDTSRNPIFDISMGFQNMDKAETRTLDQLQVEAWAQSGLQVSRLDLHLDGFELDGELHFTFEYTSDLFRQSTIKRMAGHFIQVARSVTADAQVTLGAINMLSAEEKQHLLYDLNNHRLEYEKNSTVQQLFEQQAAAFPNRPALTDADRVLTYEALNAKANQLAALLREKNVQPDQPVVLLMDRSVEMVIGMLGVLKSGACYVPVDYNYPIERIQFMIKDCGARVVLTVMSDVLMELAGHEAFAGIDWVMLDDESVFEGGTQNLPLVNKPNDLAYIIYTSATTGTSKGVMLEHRGLLNLVANTQKLFSVTENDNVLQFATPSFDASVFEIFTALLSGAALHVVPARVINDYNLFEQYINERGISFTLLPPVYAQQLNPDAVRTLRVLITGGSASSFQLAQKWQKKLLYVNAYGPTEITVVASYFLCSPQADLPALYSSVPIGQPLANTQVYVLDDQLQPVPIGVAGELCMAGDGVARGYCNQEALTADRFIDNPFGEGKMYRSGDLACWTSDGNLEFRGRKDDQVKIRGFRIEPAEVEKVLQRHEAVKEAVVTALADRNNPSEKILCAYYVPKEQEIAEQEIRRHLERSLPAYMIPQFIFMLHELPLTINGKVDKKKLPVPGGDEAPAAAQQLPATKFEQDIAGIWQSVLKKEAVSMNDNFFSLGGDSIKAITLVSQMNKQLSLKLVINNIFGNQTISSLVKFIGEQKKDGGDIPSVEEAQAALAQWKETFLSANAGLLPEVYEDIYPVSDIQAGMFFHNLINKRLYHNQVVFEVDDPAFDYEAFCETIRLLAAKHAIFRSSFYISNTGAGANIVHPVDVLEEKVTYHDLSGLPEEERKGALEQMMDEDIEKGFDLSRPGLWRIVVFKLAPGAHAVLLACHHAIMDGWSDAVFLTELSGLYQRVKQGGRFTPAPLKCSYKDFIADQWRYKAAASVKEYWKKTLQGYERLPMPFVKQGGDLETIEKDHHYFLIPDELCNRMQEYAKDNELSLKHICLAAYICLLQLTAGKNDITIGVLGHGRPEVEDGEKMLGCFLNTAPFRVKFDKILYAREVLDTVKQAANSQQGFDKLSLADIVQVTGERTTEQNPIFDVFFGYLNFHVYQDAASGMKTGTVSRGFGLNNTLFDLIVEYYDQLMVSFHYVKGLYSAGELNRISAYYTRIIERLITYPMEVMDTTHIMPAAEVEQLMNGFNATHVAYPPEDTVVSIFEQQVQQTPGSTAIRFNDTNITYAELNSRANKLAGWLCSRQVQPEEPVVLLAERTADMVIAMLAVLKAGGCYVPVDASWPAERIMSMTAECNARIVINCTAQDITGVDNYILVHPGDAAVQAGTDTNPASLNTASSLAYIMYTSGTTGVPKGAMIEHKSIIRLVKEPSYVTLDETTKILLTGSVSFDATTFEIWGALLNGGELHLLPHEQLMDHVLLKQYIAANAINTMWFTSSWFNHLADLDVHLFNGLRYLLAGGEKLSPAHIAKVQQANSGVQVINGYGPTENTTFSICYPVKENVSADIPLGYPINNTKVFILNPHRQLLPAGVPGEIYLAGDGLARGYYRQPELSMEKFVNVKLGTQYRLYASGDLGRWTSEGTVEFSGRMDEQLKIRGYRIEPGEIEQVLLGNEAVAGALINPCRDDRGSLFLAAYIVPVAGMQPAVAGLRQYVQNLLPDYMVPAAYVLMDKFPLTPNGKIDRAALPQPVVQPQQAYQAPRNKTEEVLAEIWKNVLSVPVAGVYDDFFELGGHSLKAFLIVSAIGRELNTTLTLRDIFKYPTIAQLAEEIKRKQWLGTQNAAETNASINVIEL